MIDLIQRIRGVYRDGKDKYILNSFIWFAMPMLLLSNDFIICKIGQVDANVFLYHNLLHNGLRFVN